MSKRARISEVRIDWLNKHVTLERRDGSKWTIGCFPWSPYFWWDCRRTLGLFPYTPWRVWMHRPWKKWSTSSVKARDGVSLGGRST